MLGAVARFLNGGDDLGDDVAGLSQDDHIADEDSLAGDLLGVVQGRARDSRFRDQHGFHDAVGGHAACAAHLDADVEQARVHLLRRELVGGRPAWCACGGAQGTLQVQVVDLDDDAVDLMNKVVAFLVDLGDALFDGRAARQHAGVGRDGQAPVAQLLVPAHLGGRFGEVLPGLDEADAVGDHRERALGGLGGVLLAQGTGSRIPRIRKSFLISFFPSLIKGQEIGDREVDLAAYLDAGGHRSGQGLRDRGDRAGIISNVFADVAVASGRGAHETTVLVQEVDGEAVDLGLGRHLKVGDTRGLGHAGLPPGELLEGEHVVEGHHLSEVRGRSKTRINTTSHSLSRRISCTQLRVTILNSL